MSDYYFETGVLRDQMADRLAGNIEQLPYVLAQMASDVPPGSTAFDEFCDCFDDLDALQRQRLFEFCNAVAERYGSPVQED